MGNLGQAKGTFPMARWCWIVAVALVLAAWVASGALVPGLPEEIPRHWDIHGKLNGYGPRWTVFLLPTTMLFMLLLFAFLPTLSPKNFETPRPSPPQCRDLTPKNRC